MATINAYLDDRKTPAGELAPLKVAINHRSKSAYIPIGIRVTSKQWDKKAQKVIGHPSQKQYNSLVRLKQTEVDRALTSMAQSKSLQGMSARELRDAVVAVISPEETNSQSDPTLFHMAYTGFMNHKTGRTHAIYEATWHRLEAFKGKSLQQLHLDDINKQWLEEFDDFLAQTSPSANARNIHLRNLRAVFNNAIDNGVTTCYPFRCFKIKPEPTRKRALTLVQLRTVMTSRLEPWQEKYRDIFMLTFMLIGINFVDLCRLTEVKEGRVEYIRAKTRRPYSIKVEPEAAAIIERLKGKKHLLYLLDENPNYRIAYNTVVRGLNSIKEALGIPELTTYWARHTWATMASSLDIPRDTIAHALGHGGSTVTDIYIDFDMRKVDAANRRVIDLLIGTEQPA